MYTCKDTAFYSREFNNRKSFVSRVAQFMLIVSHVSVYCILLCDCATIRSSNYVI